MKSADEALDQVMRGGMGSGDEVWVASDEGNGQWRGQREMGNDKGGTGNEGQREMGNDKGDNKQCGNEVVLPQVCIAI